MQRWVLAILLLARATSLSKHVPPDLYLLHIQQLYQGLERLAWPKRVLEMQRHWMGRSQGCLVSFDVVDMPQQQLQAFTTRAETIFGAAFVALSPNHDLLHSPAIPGWLATAPASISLASD